MLAALLLLGPAMFPLQMPAHNAAAAAPTVQATGEKPSRDKIFQEADLVQNFLEKYRGLADASIDGAKSEKDLAQAQQTAYQAELELFQARDARDKAVDAEFATASLAASMAQEKALRAYKTAADKNKGVADKLSNIEDKRMDLFQVRAKLVVGVR